MKTGKTFLMAGMLAAVILLAFTPRLMAGAGPEPPDNATITGPEIWGVLVIYCDQDPAGPQVATIRVKRVVDCNVETEALVELTWAYGCPADADQLVGKGPPVGVTFFGLAGTPFITKVKNFRSQTQGNGTVVSCDAQFKFWH